MDGLVKSIAKEVMSELDEGIVKCVVTNLTVSAEIRWVLEKYDVTSICISAEGLLVDLKQPFVEQLLLQGYHPITSYKIESHCNWKILKQG